MVNWLMDNLLIHDDGVEKEMHDLEWVISLLYEHISFLIGGADLGDRDQRGRHGQPALQPSSCS